MHRGLKEANIVVTNPPFSLFKEYLAYLVEHGKNAITYNDVFPLIKANKLWMGVTIHSGDREFRVPDHYPLNAAGSRVDENGAKYIRVKGDAVNYKRGIFEYLLGGSTDTELLDVRVFDKKVTRAAYTKQTQAAQAAGKSNCPLCAVGNNANKTRIYDFDEMDADHVSAWSKGGATSAKNCEMLCTTHNRAKGNN